VGVRARLRRRDDTGAATTTVAIVTPAVLVLLMLAVQAGLFWHARQRADAAATRAAAAAAEVDGTPTAGEAAAETFLAGAPIDNAAVTVTRDAQAARATVTGTAPALVPGVVWQVKATAEAPREQFIAEPERQ
jgi:Flp pilus assembly protein TadG